MGADTGRIAAAALTSTDVDDASQVSRFKRVIGYGLLSRTDQRRATEIAIAVNALNQMLELGRPGYIRLS